MRFLKLSPYIKKEEEENVKNYKYQGGDLSILYTYCIGPLCNWLVNFLPKTLAPNVITIIGFFLNVAYFLATLIYTGWKGSDYIPPWVCFFSAFCYCTYIILDNMDGKQARRTNSSSPLGLLVDHGTDATTTFWITLGLGSIMFFTSACSYSLIWILITVPFFLNTWEQYHTGALYLLIIHGVSEGTVLIAIVESISGIWGSKFWYRTINLFGNGIQFNTLVAVFAFVAGLMFGFISLFKVLRNNTIKKMNALLDCLGYVCLLVSYLSVLLLSKSTIVEEYPKLLILTYGFYFAKMMGLLQLAHITKSAFKPLYLTTIIPIATLFIHSLVYSIFKIEILCSIDIFILIFLVWNFISWAHFVYFCSEEMCEILNIKRFSLGKRKAEVVPIQVVTVE